MSFIAVETFANAFIYIDGFAFDNDKFILDNAAMESQAFGNTVHVDFIEGDEKYSIEQKCYQANPRIVNRNPI